MLLALPSLHLCDRAPLRADKGVQALTCHDTHSMTDLYRRWNECALPSPLPLISTRLQYLRWLSTPTVSYQ
jgi:hypothetical protein